jgi:hypothetical protein
LVGEELVIFFGGDVGLDFIDVFKEEFFVEMHTF